MLRHHILADINPDNYGCSKFYSKQHNNVCRLKLFRHTESLKGLTKYKYINAAVIFYCL